MNCAAVSFALGRCRRCVSRWIWISSNLHSCTPSCSRTLCSPWNTTREKAVPDLVKYCQQAYDDNSTQLALVNEFGRDYQSEAGDLVVHTRGLHLSDAESSPSTTGSRYHREHGILHSWFTSTNPANCTKSKLESMVDTRSLFIEDKACPARILRSCRRVKED